MESAMLKKSEHKKDSRGYDDNEEEQKIVDNTGNKQVLLQRLVNNVIYTLKEHLKVIRIF